MSLSPKNTGTPRLGDVANLARSVDRLDGIERKIDTILKSQADVIRRLDTLEGRSSKARR
jgi:hypothetical protein